MRESRPQSAKADFVPLEPRFQPPWGISAIRPGGSPSRLPDQIDQRPRPAPLLGGGPRRPSSLDRARYSRRITARRTVLAGAAPPESTVTPAKAPGLTPIRRYAAAPPSTRVKLSATPLAGSRTASW
jgi:hypothetical protein